MSGNAQIIAALADLPGAGSHRLGRLLRDRDIASAWHLVRSGKVAAEVAPAEVRAAWTAQAGGADLDAYGAALRHHGVIATSWHDAAHPPAFTNDIDPAPVAFRRGALPSPDARRVAIVGTRRASAIGREVARELGAELAAVGVVVVSGLALGIDGAAHQGALSAGGAPPVAIVGSGIDVVYPTRHRELWHQIADVGAVLTEAPLGARPDAWRFPARNRLIAAMAELVVVVESRAAGGSLLTVDQAIRRGVDVMAVPGSLRNGAAIGTNQLLADGCGPVRDAEDICMALGLSTDRVGSTEPRDRHRSAPLSPTRTIVLEAVDDGPTSIDQIADRVDRPVATVCAEVGALAADGLIVFDGARVRRA